MREKMENALWRFGFAVKEKFLKNERGDSNMVAVIVLIVIVLAVAFIFKDTIVTAAQDMMNEFTRYINS